MRGRRVVIELSPSRIELAVVRAGRILAARVHRMSSARWADNFETALREAADRLSVWTAELALQRAPATLLYSSPTSLAAVLSCPAGAGAAGARRAARLALTERITFPISQAAISIEPLAGVQTRRGDASQIHMLAAADRADVVERLADLVEGSGLRFERLLPAEAVLIADAVDAATRAATPGRPSLAVHLAEHSLCLAAAGDEGLKFVRLVALGAEGFVEPLTGGIRSDDRELGTVTLTHEKARRLLFRAGIQAPEALVDADLNITGAAVLPLLRPVLQRLAVEVKQSVRFGLRTGQGPVGSLSLRGFGSLIPRLEEVLAHDCGLDATPASAPPPFDVDALSSQTGPIAAECALRQPGGLTPAALERARLLRRVRAGMWIGAAAAGLALAADAGSAHLELRNAKLPRDVLARAITADTPTRALFEALARADAAAAATRQRLADYLGPQTDWAGVLELLAAITPEQIRMTDLTITNEVGKPSLTLTASASDSDDLSAARAIAEYLASLEDHPLVDSTELGTTLAQGGAGSARTFRLTIRLVPLPPHLVETALTALASGPTAEENPR